MINDKMLYDQLQEISEEIGKTMSAITYEEFKMLMDFPRGAFFVSKCADGLDEAYNRLLAMLALTKVVLEEKEDKDER